MKEMNLAHTIILAMLTIFIIMLALIFASVSFANTGTLKNTHFLNVLYVLPPLLLTT